MTPPELASIYRAYIACLNARTGLSSDVSCMTRSGITATVSAWPAIDRCWKNDYATIPDLHFEIELLVSEPPHVASRLRFNCSPAGRFRPGHRRAEGLVRRERLL